MTEYVSKEEWEQYCRMKREESDRIFEEINRRLRAEYQLELAERMKPKPQPPPKPPEPLSVEDNSYADYLFTQGGGLTGKGTSESEDDD